ncbi:MAG: hypothetical protein LBI63_05320 [Candidatus Ancillula sp.]|jgi:hypothetical protein|nr:hypothetical protein [Candidatus Ancillula sp.]
MKISAFLTNKLPALISAVAVFLLAVLLVYSYGNFQSINSRLDNLASVVNKNASQDVDAQAMPYSQYPAFRKIGDVYVNIDDNTVKTQEELDKYISSHLDVYYADHKGSKFVTNSKILYDEIAGTGEKDLAFGIVGDIN